MSDRPLDHLHIRRSRGKVSRAKRGLDEPGRAVRDEDGRIIAQVRGRFVTDEDVEQARLLVRWMPTYTGTQGHGDG